MAVEGQKVNSQQETRDRVREWSVIVWTFQRVSVSHLAADEDMISEPEWLRAG